MQEVASLISHAPLVTASATCAKASEHVLPTSSSTIQPAGSHSESDDIDGSSNTSRGAPHSAFQDADAQNAAAGQARRSNSSVHLHYERRSTDSSSGGDPDQSSVSGQDASEQSARASMPGTSSLGTPPSAPGAPSQLSSIHQAPAKTISSGNASSTNATTSSLSGPSAQVNASSVTSGGAATGTSSGGTTQASAAAAVGSSGSSTGPATSTSTGAVTTAVRSAAVPSAGVGPSEEVDDLRRAYADMKRAYDDMKGLLNKSMKECVRLSEEIMRWDTGSEDLC